jgi:hypothetical protein
MMSARARMACVSSAWVRARCPSSPDARVEGPRVSAQLRPTHHTRTHSHASSNKNHYSLAGVIAGLPLQSCSSSSGSPDSASTSLPAARAFATLFIGIIAPLLRYKQGLRSSAQGMQVGEVGVDGEEDAGVAGVADDETRAFIARMLRSLSAVRLGATMLISTHLRGMANLIPLTRRSMVLSMAGIYQP